MVAGRIDHSLIPRTAVVLDFDPDVKLGADRDPDGELSARQSRVAVLGSVGGEFGRAEDHIVCPRAVLKDLAQVGAYSADMLGAAGIGDA